ncbi:MAG TPA: glycosyltransferase family 39 protein [Gemmatimonadaceae bacterium]|nr:glycosyltransferase family 39 protein [Gemmatimonadaceae bacterium]
MRRANHPSAFESSTPTTLIGRHKMLLAALLAGHGLLAWQLRARGIFTFGDDAAYLLLGRSLRAFNYREPYFVGNPVAARFPPGYPAFLAAVTGPFGEHLGLVSAAGILVSVAGMLFLFDVVRRRWSTELALLVIAAAAVNPQLLANASNVQSETLYTTLTLGSLWAADRAVGQRDRRERGVRAAVVAGGLAIAAALTRSVGVTLIGALGLHWLFRRRYRWVMVFAAASAVTVGAWLSWTVVAPAREVRRSYVDDAVNIRVGDGSLRSTIVERLKGNVVTYGGQAVIEQLALPLTSRTRLDNVGWVLAIVVLLTIGLLSAWGRWNAVVWYVGAYGALLAVWAWTIERFLGPVLPLLIALIVIGAGVASSVLTGRRQWLAPAIVAMVLAGAALREDAREVTRALECDRARVDCALPRELDFLDAVAYLAGHSAPDARVIAPKAPSLYYHARRQALFWDEVVNLPLDSLDGFLRRARVSYIITTPVFSDGLTVVSLSLRDCARLDLVRAFSPYTLLLAVRPEGAPPAPDGAACRALERAAKTAGKGNVWG